MSGHFNLNTGIKTSLKRSLTNVLRNQPNTTREDGTLLQHVQIFRVSLQTIKCQAARNANMSV